MAGFKRLLKQPEFQLFLFFIYLVSICLPFFIFPGKNEPVNMFSEDIFSYFFIIWGIVIALLYLISRSLDNTSEPSGDTQGETDV